MIIVRSLNSGDKDATLTDFPLEEKSKLFPKASQRTSLSRINSTYTDGLVNIGRLM